MWKYCARYIGYKWGTVLTGVFTVCTHILFLDFTALLNKLCVELEALCAIYNDGFKLNKTFSFYTLRQTLIKAVITPRLGQLFQKKSQHPPKRSICFCICQHSNHPWIRDNRNRPSLWRKIGFGSLPPTFNGCESGPKNSINLAWHSSELYWQCSRVQRDSNQEAWSASTV